LIKRKVGKEGEYDITNGRRGNGDNRRGGKGEIALKKRRGSLRVRREAGVRGGGTSRVSFVGLCAFISGAITGNKRLRAAGGSEKRLEHGDKSEVGFYGSGALTKRQSQGN